MRVQQTTNSRDHLAATPRPDDHHSVPRTFDIDNTSQVIAGGATFDLDVALSRSDFQAARVMIMGARRLFGNASNPFESAEVHVSRNLAEAMGQSLRDAQALYRIYTATYAKVVSDAYLTHKIFDTDTNSSNRYIGLVDAILTGSVLRLSFKNWVAGPKTLWVKGKALVW